jgi:hypothetical protein
MPAWGYAWERRLATAMANRSVMKTLFVRLTFATVFVSLWFATAPVATASTSSSRNQTAPQPQSQLTLKRPDLTIKHVRTSIVLPCPPSDVPSLRFIVEVDNIGTLSVTPGPANQAVAVHGPTHIVRGSLPFVAAGGTALVQLVYRAQPGEPKAYPNVAFTFTVNGNHSILESDYTNNTFQTTPAMPPGICNAVGPGPPAPAPTR